MRVTDGVANVIQQLSLGPQNTPVHINTQRLVISVVPLCRHMLLYYQVEREQYASRLMDSSFHAEYCGFY